MHGLLSFFGVSWTVIHRLLCFIGLHYAVFKPGNNNDCRCKWCGRKGQTVWPGAGWDDPYVEWDPKPKKPKPPVQF